MNTRVSSFLSLSSLSPILSLSSFLACSFSHSSSLSLSFFLGEERERQSFQRRRQRMFYDVHFQFPSPTIERKRYVCVFECECECECECVTSVHFPGTYHKEIWLSFHLEASEKCIGLPSLFIDIHTSRTRTLTHTHTHIHTYIYTRSAILFLNLPKGGPRVWQIQREKRVTSAYRL